MSPDFYCEIMDNLITHWEKCLNRQGNCTEDYDKYVTCLQGHIIRYPTAFPYGNGMVLHFYQQQESSTTKTVHKVINKGLKTYV